VFVCGRRRVEREKRRGEERRESVRGDLRVLLLHDIHH